MVAAVGILPLQQNFSLFGKLGGFFSDSNASATAGPFAAARDDSNSEWLAGIGAMYNFSRNFAVRAEAEFIGSDTQFYSIGLQYKF